MSSTEKASAASPPLTAEQFAPITPTGSQIINSPKFSRWQEQGYASQESDGLWLHYTAICDLLRDTASQTRAVRDEPEPENADLALRQVAETPQAEEEQERQEREVMEANQNYMLNKLVKSMSCVPPHPNGPRPHTRFDEFDDDSHPANLWWKKHGQFMMSGGGRREFIWACRGWIAREQYGEGVDVTGESRREDRGPR